MSAIHDELLRRLDEIERLVTANEAILNAERLAEKYKDITPAPELLNSQALFSPPENRNQFLFAVQKD